jgi:hypothetical protein
LQLYGERDRRVESDRLSEYQPGAGVFGSKHSNLGSGRFTVASHAVRAPPFEDSEDLRVR